MLVTVLMVVDFIVCVALIGAVLLQTGRGAGLSSSFGGGDGAFFGKGNDLDTVLSKATIVLGTAFGVITLALAKLNA
jgi:preprotein translocase subunit SecG